MEKTYSPEDIESRHYERWNANGWFAPSGSGDPYCIVIPPPNVTGTLHMGHAFQDAIMDALIRYHRMLGRNTLWQVGTDHAGIATQMVVERQLNAEGKSKHDLGRDAFVERVWQWKHESGGNIAEQLKMLAASVDWSRDRFTMDPELSVAVTEVFVRLHEEGLIYRGKRLVNWDPVLHTALSDLEVLSEEEPGHLWHFRYPLVSGNGHVTVATTRPETMLGDSAVAVHPDDPRYADIVGEMLELPLVGAKDPGHRRRLRRPGVRVGLREDHACTRFQRLRRRPAARPAAIQHLRRQRGHQRRCARSLSRDLIATMLAKRSSWICRRSGW